MLWLNSGPIIEDYQRIPKIFGDFDRNKMAADMTHFASKNLNEKPCSWFEHRILFVDGNLGNIKIARFWII